VLRHIPRQGEYLLDAGSGPIQYPEYLEYSAGYHRRVCLDLSARALRAARERIGTHGIFVVGDVAHLPFAADRMDGVVSLHTLHHLPPGEQQQAFHELARVLRPGATAAVVYGWGPGAPIQVWTRWPIRLVSGLLALYRRAVGRGSRAESDPADPRSEEAKGTRTFKHGYQWLVENTRHLAGLQVFVWRSVGTNFLRTFVHERLQGRWWLRRLYGLEERAPHWFGRNGQYPLIVFSKPAGPANSRDEG
jgi:SAM-dependent methyltransferase